MKILRILLITTLLFTTGCATTTGKWWQSSEASEDYLVHTVKYPGEHLFLIAHWYTGNGHNWHEIQKHNPELAPEKIALGQQIRIPKKLVRTGAPLKRSVVVVHTVTSPRVGQIVSHPVVNSKPSIGLPLQGQVIGLHTGQVTPTLVRQEARSVKIISGCEHLDDNAQGLATCALLLEKALGNLSEY